MTPADLARDNAISFECKKDALRQNQSGDWKIAFTVQGLDMDERLTKAFPGTRYMAVLVEIGADELPVHQPKEVMPHPGNSRPHNAKPQPDAPDKPQPVGAKRDWRDFPPSAQSGTRCNEPTFRAFLDEEYGFEVKDKDQAAIVVRQLCKVESRREFDTDQAAKARWQGLDDQFLAWKFTDA